MKRTLAAVLCAAMILAALSLSACGGKESKYEGTYYLYDERTGEIDKDTYITFKDGTWTIHSMELNPSGKYKVTDGGLSLLYVLDEDDPAGQSAIRLGAGKDGETVEIYTGTVEDGKLTLDSEVMGEHILFYLEGKAPAPPEKPERVDDGYGGIYYSIYSDELYIVLDRGEWRKDTQEMEGDTGTYTVEDGRITLYTKMYEVDVPCYEGTIEGDTLTLIFPDNGTSMVYRKDT